MKASPHHLLATRPFSGPRTEPYHKSPKHLINFPYNTCLYDNGISALVALEYKHRNKLHVQLNLRLNKNTFNCSNQT